MLTLIFILFLTLFIISLAWVVYPVFVYPYLLRRLAMKRKRMDFFEAFPSPPPRVSFVIIAHNEEKAISEKLENTLSLDYPQDRFEVIVASDGSTDATNEIVQKFAGRGVRLFAPEKRVGKTPITNMVARECNGEILVFSDATGEFSKNAVKSLVKSLYLPSVGCATGRVAYRYSGSSVDEGFRTYQNRLVPLRRVESDFHTEVSVSGSIHAVRKEHFSEIPSHLPADLHLPYTIARQGLRTVYVDDAVSVEETRKEAGREYNGRVRAAILAYSFVNFLKNHRGEIEDGRYLFQVFSHKVMRWFMPQALLALLVSSLFLSVFIKFFWIVFLTQALFYLTAFLSHTLSGRFKLPPITGVPLFFTISNIAFLEGFFRG
ncbi:MAG: glycosyltransferase, partial [Deltaproteobacteria bacterium]|nr:glycosyltransferase [Deltaproteobacteria bacterium]